MVANEAIDGTTDIGGQINPHGPGMEAQQEALQDEKVRESPCESVSKEAGYVDVKEDDDLPDPFVPFEGLQDERKTIVTIRALFIGICCGALVNASNIYLGLKTGWTFSANLFGAIVGFAVIKACSRTFAENFPILGGDFGPRENNIVQTAATAAGGMSSVFISAFPALYQLNLLDTPSADFWRIVGLTAVGGYFGFFFATPLRKFFIIYVARELRLVFPTPTATAMTIRSMHEAVGGEALAKKKTKALSIAFAAALVLRVVSQYAIGILWDWHIFTWFFIWGNYNNAAIYVENWGWGIIEWTPAFIGSGMLVGLNVAWSFLGGSVLAWGIIGPLLIRTGTCFGVQYDPTSDKWSEYVSFASMSESSANKETPSPRYWLVWPGVLMMIAVSFTELFMQWRILAFAGKAVFRGISNGIYTLSKAAGNELSGLKHEQAEEDTVEDPAAPEDLVKMWMWMPGLLLSIIMICVVLGVEFGMPVGESLLAVFLAFFFSFLAIQCTGVTDITPLTAASKASQIVLGGATKGEGWGIRGAQRLNLLGGAIASIGANQSTDLVCDFRVGFLLRTPPKQQWFAQGVGTICAVFLAPAMFVLFAKAYPCILNVDEAATCPFAAPSVSAWRAVAVAVTDPTFPIPNSSGIFSICFAILGSAMVMIRHFFWVGKLEWMRAYHPNMMCVGLAFTLPQTVYGVAMVMGSGLAYIWAKKNPASFDMYGYAIAAGLIAGEGIGGVINALFQVAGISGDKYGTNIACPLDYC
jgi:OPT family oligopeptide transporter